MEMRLWQTEKIYGDPSEWEYDDQARIQMYGDGDLAALEGGRVTKATIIYTVDSLRRFLDEDQYLFALSMNLGQGFSPASGPIKHLERIR